MKIYFAGSIRGGRENVGIYNKIIEYLKNFGQVLTEHIGDKNLGEEGEPLGEKEIHDRDLKWMNEADILVAELTTPSLGVGYEIAKAIQMEKKVLCLYIPKEGKKLSAMIKGCPEVTNKEYNNFEEAKEIIEMFFTNQSPS